MAVGLEEEDRDEDLDDDEHLADGKDVRPSSPTQTQPRPLQSLLLGAAPRTPPGEREGLCGEMGRAEQKAPSAEGRQRIAMKTKG